MPANCYLGSDKTIADLEDLLSECASKHVGESREQEMKGGGLKPTLVSLYIEMLQGPGKGRLLPENGGLVVPTPTTFETFAKQVFAPTHGA